MSFSALKPGDKVTRLLGGTLPMEMIVVSVTPDEINCTVADALKDEFLAETQVSKESLKGLCWTFDPATGAEIDEDLGWGPKYGVTGSTLVKK